MENSVLEMKDDSLVMKLMYNIVKMVISSGFKGKDLEKDSTFKMMFQSAVDCSLNGMKNNIQMDNHLLEGLLMMANGHFFKGVKEMLRK